MKSVNTVLPSLFVCLASFASAQQVARVDAPQPVTPIVAAESSADASSAMGGGVTHVTPKRAADWEPQFHRWFDLNQMDFSLRYRGVSDSNGAHQFDQGQERSIIDARFKFDPESKYSIVFHASSGRYFNWAYADFIGGGNKQAYALEEAKMNPLQLGTFQSIQESQPGFAAQSELSGGWSFYIRRLYLDLRPVDGLEAEYGSLDINRGAGSEITTYDNDGWISGERVMLKKPSWLYADEISATWAYIGDLYTPNFFVRGDRLAQSNYHQFLVRKAWHQRIDASADYTWQYGTQTLRQALAFTVPEIRVADLVRLETYQRINNNLFPGSTFLIRRANGWALSFDKHFKGRGRLEYGYVDVDTEYTVYTNATIAAILGLASNGDAYGIGKRFYVRPTLDIKPYFSLTAYYTHAFDTTVPNIAEFWNRQALNAGFVFDIKRALFGAPPAH
jgi:hypothetical protein